MRKIAFSLVVAFIPAAASAGEADGVWKTEAESDGGYLQVTMGPCASDAAKTCGVITSAFNAQGADPNYANLGKLIATEMTTSDGKKYSGGTIWDPAHDKTYSSKMTVKGDKMDVEGCISIICSGQDWTRVK
jgi:uncharacterized protein (DUF2147 family)